MEKDDNKNMENWEDVKGKKTGASTIIIIVLVLIILGLGCFIFLNKDSIFASKGNEKESKEVIDNEKEESVSFSDSELAKYVEYISPVSIGPSALLYNANSVDSSLLSASKKIEYIGSLIYSKATYSDDYHYSIITEEDVKKAVEEVYGPNTYEKAVFNLGCGDYNLKEDGKYYSQTGCGGTTMLMAKNIVLDYKATKSKLEITTGYALYDGSDDTIYKDYDQNIALEKISGSDNRDDYLTNFIKNNPDKVSHIVYTFTSEDGKSYYFQGFKNNK